jgi:hypothetical protein
LQKALFVTLTYHHWAENPMEWKRQLALFVKRVQYRYPHASIFWRLEAQKRGAPHFHLIVFGVPWLQGKTVARWWAECIGLADDAAQLAAGTEVRRVKSYKAACAYVGKYIAKDEDDKFATEERESLDGVGRLWGLRGEQHVPFSVCKVWRVPSLTSSDGRLRHWAASIVPAYEEVPWTQRWGLLVPSRRHFDGSKYGWQVSEWDGHGRRVHLYTRAELYVAMEKLGLPLHKPEPDITRSERFLDPAEQLTLA